MKIKHIFLTFLVIFSFSFLITHVNAADEDNDAEDLRDKIEEYEEKISDLQGKAKTLQNEISYMDSQISLTELRIQESIYRISQTEEKIKDLAEDIENLRIRIEKLEDAIDYQTEVLSSRMRERYKSRESSGLMVLFGSETFKELIQKTEYLKVMELHDNKLIDEMAATKDAFEVQKRLFVEKKEEEEALKRQLEVEKANLDAYRRTLEDQKVAKQSLLEKTQNDEVKYQELLADAIREYNQIVGAAEALINQQSREVEKGEAIGIQGNTGYSFGDHLHFGVYRHSSLESIVGWDWYYSDYVDPNRVLKEKNVYWNTGCESPGNRETGDGDWSWPMSSPTISQGYGHTCWSSIYYGGKIHPAYDMYGSSGSVIYAVEDGDAYFCRNCLGDGGNGVFIFHDDDYMTLYWHLQ
ncbi:hypothetical protein ACFLZ4_02295 [Patescibacteria group bacterium]